MTTRTEALDEALERLTGYAYQDGPGLACHGPMGAEALSSLGHDALVGGWVEAYKTNHPPIAAPPALRRIDLGDETSWRAALGDFTRVTDWHAMFIHELDERPWPAVLSTWLPRLLPGYGGGLTHGLLRVAHGVRALPDDGEPSDLALTELARGLASWAGWFNALPGRPDLRGALTLDKAVDGLPRPAERWSPIEAGMFTRLDGLEGFTPAVEALGPPEADPEALSDLTAAFCRMLLADPLSLPQGAVHMVTPAAAVRTLLPHLPGVTVQAVYAQLWHGGAAIACGFLEPTTAGGSSPAGGSLTDDEPPVPLPAPAEMAARAAEHGDPHVVKFTEACIRENALRPDPVYLLAAQHVLDRTPAVSGSGPA
jgi:hypothetical protein